MDFKLFTLGKSGIGVPGLRMGRKSGETIELRGGGMYKLSS